MLFLFTLGQSWYSDEEIYFWNWKEGFWNSGTSARGGFFEESTPGSQESEQKTLRGLNSIIIIFIFNLFKLFSQIYYIKIPSIFLSSIP